MLSNKAATRRKGNRNANDKSSRTGAHNRIWTGDLFLTKEVLYQLSYMSTLRCWNGAGDGNRTHVISLEGWSSTIELHPQTFITEIMVEGGGFEPPKDEPSDLQSDPFGHSGTPPKQ